MSRGPVLRQLPANDEEWRAQAACRGMATEIFYPGDDGTYKQARAVCRRCPVRRECLDFVLSLPDFEDPVGMWANTLPGERRQMRAARRGRRR